MYSFQELLGVFLAGMVVGVLARHFIANREEARLRRAFTKKCDELEDLKYGD